jgi:branched-chain amino acid transport system substrate-binding protein
LIQEQGKAWFFKTESTNSEVIKALMMQAKRMGAKKLGLQITTQAFGSDLETETRKYLPQFGLDLVGVVRCEPDSKDLTIQATRLRATNPDLVIHQNYPADQVVFARALKTIGWNPPSIGPGLIINICLGLSPVELYEGWIAQSIWDRDKPSAKAVWDKYEAYTKKRLETDLSLRGYDTAQILFEILRLSGDPDNSEAIRDAFYKLKNFPVIAGRQGAVCNYAIGKNYILTAQDFVFNVVKAGKMMPWIAK